MASQTFINKRFTPVPPEKGSFPLDREGECKQFYAKYMLCMMESKNTASMCRQESKDYLKCRMDKGLMTRESWQKLGYGDIQQDKNE